MKKWHLLVAITGSLTVMAAPCAAQRRPAPPKPTISAQPTKSPTRSARTGAARGHVASGKAVAQRGRPSLRAQKDSLIRLIGRAEGLKPQRFQLRQQAINAARAYRADSSPANRAAWRAAVRAYLPVRQAHELARGQRDSALARYKLSKSQREAAMKSAARAAAIPPPLPPMPGRPAIRREAAVRNLGVLRAAAASSRETIYSNLGLIERPQGAGSGNYATSAAQFRAGLPEISNYSPLPSAPTASTGTFSSLRFNSLDTLPTMPLVQNAAGGN